MKYQVHYIDVGDADAIILYYQEENQPCKIVLIDAGNVSDSEKIKRYINSHFRTNTIDYAICTHPDRDHKGGFFNLLNDSDVRIKKLYIKDPWQYLSVNDFDNVRNEENAKKKARSVYNHPNDSSINLIKLAQSKGTEVFTVNDGDEFEGLPLKVVGPSERYFKEVVLDMVNNFAELQDEANFERYDEVALPPEDYAKSVIDEDDDTSDTNKSSIMLLFTPGNRRFLFLGDATCASIKESLRKYNLSNCIVKIPHHGSKHNMTTEIIDKLNPVCSVISAIGSKKHPNSGLVYWLSKYGKVYSTHKSRGLYASSEPGTRPAIPLREKQE